MNDQSNKGIPDLHQAADDYGDFIQRIAYQWPGLDKLHKFVNEDFVVATTPARITLIEITSRSRIDQLDGGTNGTNDNGHITHNDVHITELVGSKELGETLRLQAQTSSGWSSRCRLFLVENLCPQVIRLFGGAFDVDPQFFADHINNTSWHQIDNIPERLPALPSVQRNESHLHLRYIEVRTLLAGRSPSPSSNPTPRKSGDGMHDTNPGSNCLDDDSASFIYPDERTTRILRKAGKFEPRARAGKSYDRLIMTRRPVTIWVRPNPDDEQGWVGRSSLLNLNLAVYHQSHFYNSPWSKLTLILHLQESLP